MTTLHKPTLETVFGHLTPITIAGMIANMDEAGADMNEQNLDDLRVMQFAIDTLFGIVGPAKAIELLAVYEVDAANPLVADAVDEWTQGND